MAYWLVKSEPSAWSWDQQVAKGAKGEAWTGVRNFTARQNLVNMKKGDKAFFYHSNEGKEIVGIAEVIKEAYPDPTDKTGKFVCVDIKADKPMPTPVTMALRKRAPILRSSPTVRSRSSTSSMNRFHPPGSGRRPSGMLCPPPPTPLGALNTRRRSPRLSIANVGAGRISSRNPSALQ